MRRRRAPKPIRLVLGELASHSLLELVHAVSRRRGVALAELCGRSRTKNVAAARQELFWRIRHHPERCYSLAEIGRLFGRDHSSVHAALATYRRRLRAADSKR
jgi:chromosomal replication initiation ATPase DnaA